MMKVEQCSRDGGTVFVLVCYACGWMSGPQADPIEAHALMPGHDCPGEPATASGAILQHTAATGSVTRHAVPV